MFFNDFFFNDFFFFFKDEEESASNLAALPRPSPPASPQSHLSRQLSSILVLLHQVGGVAHVVAAHHAVGVVHADGVDGEPAVGETGR